MRRILFANLIVVTLLASSCDRKPRTAAGEPQPEATPLLLSKEHPPVVVIAPEALAAEEYAAKELAHYLGKILQLEVPIVRSTNGADAVPIFVGYHPENAGLTRQKLDIEESVYVIDNNAVHIVGGRSAKKNPVDSRLPQHDRGTLYAVYDFLESLGVRWYRPEPWGEHVPQMNEIALKPGEHRSKPAFQYRYGINHYQTFAPLENQITDSKEREDVAAERRMARVWAVRNRQNCNLWTDPELGGYHRINFAHSYLYHVPHKKYFSSHPEYFALVNGKRSSDPNAQLCLSNPEVEELVFQSLLKSFKQYPDLDIASLDPNDYGIWCECEGCRAMDDPALRAGHSSSDSGALIAGVSMSNRVVAFNNRIAKRLREVLPGKKVGWYAYYLHTEVPTKVNHLEENTGVMAPGITTKSGLMLGLGEKENEIFQAMDDLREHGVGVLTIGQYLRPSPKHLPVVEYIAPEVFDLYGEIARKKGFVHVSSGPLVRSSYHAGDFDPLKLKKPGA